MAFWAIAAMSGTLALGAAGGAGAKDNDGQSAELGGNVYEMRTQQPAPPSGPVTLKLMQGDKQVASTQADPTGVYSLKAAPGAYHLQVVASGEDVADLNVALVPGSSHLNVAVPTEAVNENAPSSQQAYGGAGTAGTPDEVQQEQPDEQGTAAPATNPSDTPYWQDSVQTVPAPAQNEKK